MNGKFRVWDEESKKFLEPERCFIDGNGNFFYRDSRGVLNNWKTSFVVEYMVNYRTHKHLYVGDRVSFINIHNTLVTGTVRYNKCQFYAHPDDNKTDDDIPYYWLGSTRLDNIKIIGNIHEVPHED